MNFGRAHARFVKRLICHYFIKIIKGYSVSYKTVSKDGSSHRFHKSLDVAFIFCDSKSPSLLSLDYYVFIVLDHLIINLVNAITFIDRFNNKLDQNIPFLIIDRIIDKTPKVIDNIIHIDKTIDIDKNLTFTPN